MRTWEARASFLPRRVDERSSSGSDKARAPSPASKGFTLLELLVAIAILAVLATTLHIILVGAIDAPRAVEASMREGLILASIQDIIRTDLEAIAIYCEPDNPVKLTDTGRSKEFEFVRFGPPVEADTEGGGLYRVTYKLATRSDGSKLLGRREEVYRSSGAVRVYSTNVERERFTPLIRKLEDFAVELHDGNAWRKKWRTNAAPAGAKISITLAADRKSEFTVYLPARSPEREGASRAAAE